jgi:hypothetical protein
MMLRKMMIALMLCGLTTGAIAQGTEKEAKDTGKVKMTKKMSERDAKGRFIKKDKTVAKMAKRDAKGRFVKKGAMEMKVKEKSGKKMPERDPKTGRFIKKK